MRNGVIGSTADSDSVSRGSSPFSVAGNLRRAFSRFYRSVAQLGRALRSGRRGRRFKSCHSDLSLVFTGDFLFSKIRKPVAFSVLWIQPPYIRFQRYAVTGNLHIFLLYDQEDRIILWTAVTEQKINDRKHLNIQTEEMHGRYFVQCTQRRKSGGD